MSPTATATRRPKNAGRRKEVEAWLDENGVEWEYFPQLPTSDFDWEKSLRNQARVYNVLDEGVVANYTEAIQRGDQFPAVVAYKPTARAKLIVVDGNHRMAAHMRAGEIPIDAYIVTKATGQTVAMMSFAANAKHGLPTSFDERVHHAIWLVDNGATHDQAAAAMNIRVSELRKAWGRALSYRRALEVGLVSREWDSLTQTTKNRLNNLATDEGFRAAAQLAFRARLTAEEVFDLVAQVNTSRSGTKQAALVKAIEEQYKDRIAELAGGLAAGATKRARGPKQTFNWALSSIAALPEDLGSLASKFAEAEREEAAKRAREAAYRLHAFADKLESS